MIDVKLINTTAETRIADLRIRLSGRTRNTGNDGYLWSVPAVPTTVAALNRNEGLDVVESFDTKLNAVNFHNRSENCCSVQGIIGIPINFEQGWATMKPLVEAHQPVHFRILLTYASSLEEARVDYIRLQDQADTLLAKSEKYWQAQFHSALSRMKTTLSADAAARLDSLPEALRRIYENAVMTHLYLRRDYPNRCGVGKLYLTLFPRHGEGSFYLWDIGMAAPFAARLDPDAVRRKVELIAECVDIYAQQSINAFTGQGGGWYYAANLWALFRLAWNYLQITGDYGWLKAPLKGIRQGQNVLMLMRELSLAWTTCTPGELPQVQRTRAPDHVRAVPGSSDGGGAPFANRVELPRLLDDVTYPFAVADTGDRGTQLEACTTYEHQVASINAGSVWMMRCMAKIYTHERDALEAGRLNALADDYAKRILAMFRMEDGFFSCGKPGGSIHHSRVALDHFMVFNCMAEDLSESIRTEMMNSFKRELQTSAWMHCVSPRDSDVVSGYRSDTTWCGSYAGFVALTAEGLCHIGEHALATEWLTRISAITAQGPFAQSYWVESLRQPFMDGPVKATDEMPQGTHWCEMGGVAFGSAILHGILGILPPWSF